VGLSLGVRGHIRVKVSDGQEYQFENTIKNECVSALRDCLKDGTTSKISQMQVLGSVSGGGGSYSSIQTVQGSNQAPYTAEYLHDFASPATSGQHLTVSGFKLLNAASTVYAERTLALSEQFNAGHNTTITVEYVVSFSGNQSGEYNGLKYEIMSMCRNALVDGSSYRFLTQSILNSDKSQQVSLGSPTITAENYSPGSSNFYAIKLDTKGQDPPWEPYYARLFNSQNTLMDEQFISEWIGTSLINLTHWVYFDPAIS